MNFPKRQNFQASEKSLIIVGSKNPVKLESTEAAFTEAFNQDFIVDGVNAASHVPDQPIGDEETFLGAYNRVINARSTFPEADYWVGIEGGVDEDQRGMFAFAWVYIEEKTGRSGQAKTAIFYLPDAVAKLVRGGLELGKADDLVFSIENSKYKGGTVGLLTKDVIDRKSCYNQAIILALIPFLNKILF